MAGEGDVVGEDDVVGDDYIVRDVHVGHQQIVAAEGGHHAASGGAAVDGDELTDFIAMADACFRGLASVFQILGAQLQYSNTDRKCYLRRLRVCLRETHAPSGGYVHRHIHRLR